MKSSSLSHAAEEKQQTAVRAGYWHPDFSGCLNVVSYKLERNTESLLKPWYPACKPFGQGSKQKSLQSKLDIIIPKTEST